MLCKRDKSNAHRTVDLFGVAYLLRHEGIQPQAARWYQRYMQKVRVISITAGGVSQAWRFKIRVFQGSPLSPRVSLYLHGGGGTGGHRVPALPNGNGKVLGGHGAILRRCARGGRDRGGRGAAASPTRGGGTAVQGTPCAGERGVLEHLVRY